MVVVTGQLMIPLLDQVMAVVVGAVMVPQDSLRLMVVMVEMLLLGLLILVLEEVVE